MVDVTYTDNNRVPAGSMTNYKIDLDIGKDNDFELQMNLKHHVMDYESIWYVDGTEYGGMVDYIKLDTYNNIVYYQGRSWRGFWAKKVIEPDKGADYLVVSGDANDVLRMLVKRLKLQDLFEVPEAQANINISSYQFDRYCTGYDGIMKMLAQSRAKPKFTYIDGEGYVRIEAVPAEDLSEKYEYSDDYGMQLVMEKNRGGVNHLICLGSGDLAARKVIHLYADADGKVSKTQHYYGLEEIEEIYDYGNAGDDTKLEEGGIERLQSLMNSESMSAKFSKLDVDVGDIVGGKNRMTGIRIKETVNSQIIKIENGRETVEYKVGDDD